METFKCISFISTMSRGEDFLRIDWDGSGLPGKDEPYKQEEVEPLDNRDIRHGKK
jgi:hypothetical protein